jgi:hypothetical protein
MSREITVPVKFEENAFYERLIKLRATDRTAFESLSPPSKLALAQYERLKREHAQAHEKQKLTP